MDRRNSDHDDHDDQQPPPRNPNVFDDDYEIEPDEDDFMPSVSDGFRPAAASETPNHQRHDHDRQDIPQRHTSTSKPNETDLRRMATRNSTAKTQDPMSHDNRPAPMHHRGPSASSPLGHRASVSSTGSFATTSNGDNPFETGPSHPYGMYPQHVARSSSVATSSVSRQSSQRPMSIQRPTHPYAMYSQSGLDHEPAEEPLQPQVPPVQTAIPVGFPGLGAGYHRVLGPDGEEQDIIGPDGHTEQLPPYSRYPEEGPTKASLAAEASASSRILPAPTGLLDSEDPFTTPVSPASPLSATSFSAPILPSVPLLESVTPARLPPQRPETQTGNVAQSTSATAPPAQVPAEPSDSSSASLLSDESGFNEKESITEKQPKWYRRKLWGKIPMGFAVMGLIILLMAAIVLGTVIGESLAKKKQPEDRTRPEHGRPDEPIPQVTGSHGSFFDATPIPTPPGLPPLPTGAYSLPLGIPQESNPGCLTQANQYSAWSCKLTFAPLVLTINNTVTSAGVRQLASMRLGSAVPDGAILYGLQTPDLSLQPLQLVLDLDYKAYGPAYHFATRYDKLVILRPDELNANTGVKDSPDDKNFRQRFQVKPGDLPWYCFWNQTYIEGYMYAEDNSTAAVNTPFPLPTGSATASFDTASFLAALATSPPPTSTSASPTSSPSAPATPAPQVRRDAASDASAPARLPPYPRIVKIEERRVQGAPQPYCQQMVLLDNGKIAPAPNGNDGPRRVPLQAVDPSWDEYNAARASSTGSRRRDSSLQGRSDPSDACHCQWMFK